VEVAALALERLVREVVEPAVALRLEPLEQLTPVGEVAVAISELVAQAVLELLF
jgi:hypothetical protein